ncbi:atherin-like [Sorghum bicolor]|uniref:atherin-like n=1 Tax=Sorghum bicolor TaxID=4558 RepID=UPI000B42685F|nr:atherin-like [Sorghum bicolor]|eukprot:XP_021303810.1 atherin-like [Sorghum bicolor]
MAAARDWAPRWDPVGGGARSVEEKKRQHLPTAPPHGGGWWAHRAFVWGAVEPRRRVPAGRWPRRAAAWGETEQGSYAAACRPADECHPRDDRALAASSPTVEGGYCVCRRRRLSGRGRASPVATPCAAVARARPVPPSTPTSVPAPASEPPPNRGRPPPTKPRALAGTLGPAHPSSKVGRRGAAASRRAAAATGGRLVHPARRFALCICLRTTSPGPAHLPSFRRPASQAGLLPSEAATRTSPILILQQCGCSQDLKTRIETAGQRRQVPHNTTCAAPKTQRMTPLFCFAYTKIKYVL